MIFKHGRQNYCLWTGCNEIEHNVFLIIFWAMTDQINDVIKMIDMPQLAAGTRYF